MPIHVDIRINETLINTLHIGRFKGGAKPDDMNTYLVVEGKRPETKDDWFTGAEYTHRYGDGAEVCVAKGLKALGYSDGDYERQRIAKNIQERVDDLRSCGKNDNCQEFADLIESYIEEWLE